MGSLSIEEKFRRYYEGWVNELEAHLQRLVLERHPNYAAIVSALTTHHKEYYTAKWGLAHDDILAFYAPAWLSPLESAFSWVTGWKPSTAFRLVESLRRTRAPLTSLAQLTDDQAQRMAALRLKIRSEEGRVEREMERQQVALGDRNLAHLAQLAARRSEGDGDGDGDGGGVKGILDGLEKVMKMADYVRLKTLKGVLDVLTPKQGVDFLAMFAMVQLQMRKWGKHTRDNATPTATANATHQHHNPPNHNAAASTTATIILATPFIS